ncbi:MAG TPA: hypothetical protein VIL69_11950, partial [Roseomonas sp.]
MPRNPEARLDAARRLIAHLAEKLQADLEIRLWNGEVVPLGPNPAGGLVIALNSPEVLTRAIRRPRLTTLIELIAAGDITLEGGTLLDLAARRGTMNRKGLLKRLDKRLLLGSLLPFLFRERTAAATNHAYAGAEAAKDAEGRDN